MHVTDYLGDYSSAKKKFQLLFKVFSKPKEII